jgi:hypothetical protein
MEQLWKLESFYERFTSDFQSQNQNDNGCHFTEEDDR